jgi:hypothetical protein
MVLYAEMDREKREVLESVVSVASRERGAYVNGGFTHPLTFILLTNLVYEITRLEKKIEDLARRPETLEVHGH